MKETNLAGWYSKKSRAFFDFVIIVIISILIFVMAGLFDVFEKFAAWSVQHEEWQIDEFFTLAVFLMVAFGVYSWRRWMEVRLEVKQRKRAEQEIKDKNEQLDAQNEELRATEEELRASNEELEAANEELKAAQEQLVRSEKLAAIGQLAGRKHWIWLSGNSLTL